MSENNLGNPTDAQIAVSDNNVYVVWDDNTAGDYKIYFKSSSNYEEMYSDILNLSNNDGSSVFPKIANQKVEKRM